MEKPLLTRVSAIHPPILANTAIVSHGSTQSSPDSVRLSFKTYAGKTIRMTALLLNHIDGNVHQLA